MTSIQIQILRFLARICGKILAFFARTQTRLLTKAQFLGWMPTVSEAAKLVVRQTQLFEYNMAKEFRKRAKQKEHK